MPRLRPFRLTMCELIGRVVQLEVGYFYPLLCRVQSDGLWLRQGPSFNPLMHPGRANVCNIECRRAFQDLTVTTWS